VQVYAFGWLRNGIYLNSNGVGRVSLHQALDRAFDRSREEKVLACGWKRRHNTFDRREEAHVQHAVRFVEDQNVGRP